MIFESGNLQVSATGQNDALTALVGESRELSASKSNSEKKSNEGKVLSYQEISLAIDYKLSPSLKLIVFVKDGNQTLTDFHTYHVEACQNHQVKAEWSDEKVYPGAPITFSVSAAPGSLCAISATDKSVELLGNKNKVTSETIGKLQADIGARKTRTKTFGYWVYQRKCPQTYDAIKVRVLSILQNMN